MDTLKLYIVLLGCKPEGRNTEQHDLFFGIAPSLASLKQNMLQFWPEAKGRLHIDAWREVNHVEGFRVEVVARGQTDAAQNGKLFFINLGGYKRDEFEEFHYKLLTVAPSKGIAIQAAKRTAFYKHTGFTGATSHIDDKYGVDVDDIYEIEDILSEEMKQRYSIRLHPDTNPQEDEIHLGYLKMEKLINEES